RRIFHWPQHWARIVRVNRMCLEEKGCDNTKITASAAHCPEKVRVFIGTSCNKASVSQNHVHTQKIINSKTALRREIADPATKRETAHASRRNDACWNRKPKCMRRMVNIPPQCSAAGKNRALLGVYADIFYR